MLSKLGSFRKQDAQDNNDITTRKQSKFPKFIDKNVAFFYLLQLSFFHRLSFEQEFGRLGRSPSAINFEGEAHNLQSSPSVTYFKGNNGGFGCLYNMFRKVCGKRP